MRILFSLFGSFLGIGTQRQQANNFNGNNDIHSYSNVRTENTTSNNNQLEAWADGDAQSTNANTVTANNMPNDQQTLSSSYLFAPLTTPQSNTINTTIASSSSSNHTNNNPPTIFNNNNDTNDDSNFGTATRLRTKFKKFKQFFSKN